MPTDDLPEAIRKADAERRALEAALAPPPRPVRKRNENALGNWVRSMVEGRVDDVKSATEGTREDTLNKAGLRIGSHLHFGIDRAAAEAELFDAAEHNGWVSEEGAEHVRWKIRRAIDDGAKQPAERPDLEAETTVAIKAKGKTKEWTPEPTKNGHDVDSRTLKLRRLSTVKSKVPMWVWKYGDVGRIQLGTLSMFAGKPSAGKSTAVRWFAARLSQGDLPGAWYGHPMKVALVMAEEQTDAVVVPGLVAAEANMENVYCPEIKIGETEFGLQISDVAALRDELVANEVRALFIDPILSTFGGKSDIYRNNEVREQLAPFVNLAKVLNGVVIGVTHINKGEMRDVMRGMNGSGAFGEVPRAVFGFAPTDAGEYVMEQVKNSAGPVGLKLAYHLPTSYLTADDGLPIELPRFEIIGETEISISDINPNDDETTDVGVAVNWLRMYLLENQPAPSAVIKRDAKQHGDIKEWTLKRAMKRLGVKVFSKSQPDKPHTTVWCLPDMGVEP